MTITEMPSYRVEDAQAALWFGRGPSGWGDVVRQVNTEAPASAASMIQAAGLAWHVEQHPLEAVTDGERLPVPRVVANVRSDTRAVLGVVGEGYERCRTRLRSPSATRSP